MKKIYFWIVLIVLGLPLLHPVSARAISIDSITDNRGVYSGSQVPKYSKLEISFQLNGLSGVNFFFPYDSHPPAGVDVANPKYKGVSVDAVFTGPDNITHRQPAFYYYGYLDGGVKNSWADDGRNSLTYEWYYPSGQNTWKVRFSPDQVGTWQYYLEVTNESGTSKSSVNSFNVASSSNHGFIKVSSKDSRYFEFGDGVPFVSTGVQEQLSTINPKSSNQSMLKPLADSGVRLVRTWHSGLFGSAWLEWQGARGIYDGYLPRAGLEALTDSSTGKAQLSLALKNVNSGGWYDACRFDRQLGSIPVKQNTNYKLQIKYQASCLTGPKSTTNSNFGVVGIIANPGDWPDQCDQAYSPTDTRVVTGYGQNASQWNTVSGNWNSKSLNFLPRVAVGLNNTLDNNTCTGLNGSTGAKAWIDSISLREDLGNGQLGPEILPEPSMQYDTYFKDYEAYRMDILVDQAEKNEVYLKMVVMEKNDLIWLKSDNDGTYVMGGEEDNVNGIYGSGRTFNRTRWLQQAYMRYLQARWGYSTAVHSWEAMNEGDPANTDHWNMTDELAKFVHCGAFGSLIGSASTDQHLASQKCTYQNPDSHMFTTSFWHSFPAYDPTTGNGLFGNSKYPNVSYADGHAYISTSPASLAEKQTMEKDSAFYHLWQSNYWATTKLPYPIVRGEAGMVPASGSTDDWGGLGIQNDLKAIWYHNFVWSQLDPGAMYEIYWYYNEHIKAAGLLHNKRFAEFVKNLPLNNGSYKDLTATVDNANIRVVGQKDIVNGRAHIWVSNKGYLWKNVADGASVAPVSGNIVISGFVPNKVYKYEKWDTYTSTAPVVDNLTANGSGQLTINVNALSNDLAYKIGDYSVQTVIKVGDTNNDNKVDIFDYNNLLTDFGSNSTRSDFNNSGKVDIFDYNLLITNFGR